jgi:DNA-binding CsgD family transcriptional regulator
MARQASIIGQVEDIDGVLYDVRERRPTEYGWDICLGWPQGVVRGKGGAGGPRVILTRELVAYLECQKATTKRVDLPIGVTAIKRLRRLLGFNWCLDRAQWWEDRADDLVSLTVSRFAEKHDVSIGAVADARRAMFGNTLRPAGWWLENEILLMLVGSLPRPLVAERLDLSLGSVGRLRHVVRKAINGRRVGSLLLVDVISLLADGRSALIVSKQCGVSSAAVGEAMHRLRSRLFKPASKRKAPEKVGALSFEAVVARIKQGDSMDDIGVSAGVSRMAVYHALRRAGLSVKKLRASRGA